MISCTEDEAKDIFRKWTEEGTPVLLMLFGPDATTPPELTVSGRVLVKEVDEEFVVVSLGEHTKLTISFSGCEFGYSDPKEAPEVIRNYTVSKYESSLTLRLPCLLFASFNELKNPQ